MANTPNYDIYLNGQGYMLARDGQGRLLRGACQENRRDPFQYYLNSEQRWSEAEFRFGAGAGAIEYDGTHRYRWGENIDTRAGRLLRGPKLHQTRWYPDRQRIRPKMDDLPTAHELSNNGAADRGLAVQFTAGSTTNLVSVGVLVKRNVGRDYGAAAVFTVEIWSDAADTPLAQLATTNVNFNYTETTRRLRYGCDPWADDDYHWAFGTFSLALTSGTKYWVVIRNNQVYEVYWGRVTGQTGTTSTWNGAAWAAGTAGQPSPCYQIGLGIGYPNMGPITSLCEFRGSDGENRLYAATGDAVIYRAPAGGWPYSKYFAADVLDLIVFNQRLYAALGLNTDLQCSTGATATTVWAAEANERALCFAIHDDMLWKVGNVAGSTCGNFVSGSQLGASGTWGTYCVVGDMGTEIGAMISHGGALFCAKPEGIFQITYPDTYPASGAPVANQVLDFKTDQCERPWMIDWQGGLYFPGTAAVYEWKNDVLRDIWTDRVDEGVQELSKRSGDAVEWSGDGGQYTTPRRFPPGETVPEDSLGFFVRGIGTTRGLVVSLTSPHLQKAGIWWWDGYNWHPMGPTFAASGEDPLTSAYLAEYITALHLQSYGSGKGRLWYGLGTDVCYWKIPTWTRDRMQLDGVDFSPYWSVDLPVFDGGKPHLKKYFAYVEIMTKNVAADPVVQVYLQVDCDRNDGDWTGVGLDVSEGPWQRVHLGVVARNIRFRLVGVYDDDDSVPLEIEAVRLSYHAMPDTLTTYDVVLRVADKLRLHNGALCDRTAKEQIEELYSLLEEYAPWTYRDPMGRLANVWALRISESVVDTWEPSGKAGPPLEAQVAVSMINMNVETDLIVNGTFDEDLSGWTGGSWEADDGYPAPGCVKLYTTIIPPAQIDQDVVIDTAGDYLVRFWFKTTDTSKILGLTLSHGMVFINHYFTNDRANRWYYKAVKVTLTADTWNVAFMAGGEWSTFYLDSIQLVPVLT